VQPFLEGKKRRRRDNSMMSEADDIAKSNAVAREVEGGGWCL
jgi:hypothetical protein